MMNLARMRMAWLTLAACAGAAILGFVLLRQGHSTTIALPEVPGPEKTSATLQQALRNSTGRAANPPNDPAAIRRLARLYLANGFTAEAQASYRLVPATAQTARDRYYLADLARTAGNLAEATSHLRATLELDPSYGPARFALAEALLKLGRDQDAEQNYRLVLAADPNHSHAALGLARIELQRGDEDAALRRLEELVASHPESSDGAGLLARILERRGETDRAAALKQLSQQRPEPAPADPWLDELLDDTYDLQRLGLRFEELFRAGQQAEANAVMQRIERLEPDNALPHLLRGWSEVQAQRHREAVPHYQTALAKGGDPEKIAPYLVQSWLALGEIETAQAWTAEVHGRFPDSVPILTAYADVALRQQNRALARSLLTKLLDKEPYLPSQNMALARILWETGEREAAVVCLRRVAEVSARDIPSRALLGEYFLSKGEAQSAIVPLEQALEHAVPKTPADRQLRVMLGSAYRQAVEQLAAQGQLSEALRFAETLALLEPADLRGHALKANLAVQLREFGIAAVALGAMAALQPENPTIHLSLGDVIYQSGRAGEAKPHWERARQLVRDTDRELIDALDARLAGRITAETFR